MNHKRLLIGFSLLASSLVAATTAAPVNAWSPVVPADGSFSQVGACETETQLDCFESISALIGDTWVMAELTGRLYNPGSTLIDGQWVMNVPDPDWFGWFHREWRIPGLVNEDGNSTIISQGRIASPGTIDSRCSPLQPNVPCPTMLNLSVTASGIDGFVVPWESGSDDCSWKSTNPSSPYFGKCTRQGHLQLGVKFRVTVRTSWLLPTVVVSKTDETRVTVERLGTNGANRVTIEGTPFKTVGLGLGVDWKNDKNSRASWNDVIIKMQILDGRYWRGGTYSNCAELPSLVVADNTWAPNSPTFSSTNGLELNVSNPHFDTDGKTPLEGRYNGTVPLTTAACLWGKDLNSKSQFIAEVIEESTGEKKAATTAVSINSNELKILASGFTFSSPTIRVTAITPTAAVSPKKLTITCKKGKTVRKVTSLRPKCPKGFKKV
jgi:hypothetical protein